MRWDCAVELAAVAAAGMNTCILQTIYYCVVQGQLSRKTGRGPSMLTEDFLKAATAACVRASTPPPSAADCSQSGQFAVVRKHATTLL